MLDLDVTVTVTVGSADVLCTFRTVSLDAALYFCVAVIFEYIAFLHFTLDHAFVLEGFTLAK